MINVPLSHVVMYYLLGRYGNVEELTWRTSLLHRIFSHPTTPKDFSLTCDQLEVIWNLMYNDIPEGNSL